MKILRKPKYYIIHFIFLTFVFCITTSGLFAQWQPDVQLTFQSGNAYTSSSNARKIAVNGDTVHIVWHDDRSGSERIYYRRSTDAGISWGTERILTNTSAGSESPSVAVSGLVVHVVWQDFRGGTNYKIYYKRSTDAGTSWGADIQLTFTTTFSIRPSASVNGQVVHVVWYDKRDGNDEIYYKRSTDGGVSWEADLRLTNNTAYSWYPCISVLGQVIHVVWYDSRDSPNFEIYYKRSTDVGSSWGSDIRLTNNPFISGPPCVGVSGQTVHVVWYDNRDGPNYEIYYKRSTDGGTSWGSDTRLTNNPAQSLQPTISTSSQAVHVAWMEERDGNYEIYYKRSTDGGTNWGSDTRLTNDPAYSGGPHLAVSEQVVHVVFYDHRDGNYEIYYKRDPTGNVVVVTNINTEIPKEFKLEQNYPNPFNPVTKIKFSIPQTGKGQIVKIVIFNILGEEVATLVNQEFQPGTYEVEWIASNYPSGIYYYKLEAGDYSETKKMVLLK